MLSGRIRRRALALLGALLLVILVWPPCCATMPKPLPVVPPTAPWDIVPPTRPHPAAAVLPVPLQPWTNGVGTLTAKRQHVPLGLGSERQQQGQEQQQQQQQEPAESESRKSRRVSEFYRLLRALSPIAQPTPTVEPYERRQSAVSAVQLNLPSRENSAVRDARDYLIEPIDKNKSQSSVLDPSAQDNAPVRANAKFDDTDPSSVLVRSRREAASANPHRHQHQVGSVGPQNGTGVWHGRRGGGGRHHHPHQQQQQQHHRNNESNLERNERSANLSHITGATRKIQLFIKNRYIQLLPDGTVNGTYDDLSDYTILQRTTVGIGQIKIQAVATCLFLCMDTCGSVYGSKEFTDDCIFNEQMEQHHYNTYSSTQHSNARRTLYLALNKTGQPRKIQIPVNRTLGKLATYTKALTQTVAHDRVEQLISRLFGADHVRHGLNQLCETGQPLVELTAKEMRPRPVCGPQAGTAKGVATATSAGSGGSGAGGGKKNNQPNASGKDEKDGLRQKKKKKRRKCREDEVPGEHCFRPGGPGTGVGGTNSGKKKAGPNQGQPRGSSSISSDSGSISPSSSNSSVGSSSAGTNQSAILSNVTSSSSSSSISNSSSANSLIASISNGGPNRSGQPYAQLTATPNTRKPKPTKKLPAGSRNGTQPPNGPSRKPKKPNQQQSQPQTINGKRNGSGGNHTKPGGPTKTRLVGASIVTSRLSHPKPASLTVARTVRPTVPFPLATARPTTKPTTISNDLQDTSQQSDSDAELDMDDVLQPSGELVDELDELDEATAACLKQHHTAKTMLQMGRNRKTTVTCTLANQQQQHGDRTRSKGPSG
ncbi:uncharacterized protein LOC125761262 isoform X2 [Anopheles funestus]|uniref:uncharacterized protein LOC125761262 isoform X2 n=1 Tax=Anopheles funestus TaxID=62324 RepID=UPI0020C6EB4E|nr:uncharacterized protein LOC125761262 isoform X2 [Anopheles funestus]XP_049278184.1 uncharacterized protein LOC125761262 isoform X2 [Anopheles funestus]